MGKLYDQMKMDMELKNLSARTMECYLARMKDFTLYFGRSPAGLGDDEIRQYLYYLKKEKRASQSIINQSYSALKFFYQRTLQRSWNSLKIPRSKNRQRLPVVLSLNEVEAIFTATQNLKHRAILMTIYSSGLRISEAVHLKVTDIDSSRMMVRVRGKGNKDRHVPLPRRTLELLRDYWRTYRSRTCLLVTKDGRPLADHRVRYFLKKALKQSGICKRVSCHTLRHSYATNLMEEGVDVRVIQGLLGHRSLKTTTLYLHITQSVMQSVQDAINDLMADL